MKCCCVCGDFIGSTGYTNYRDQRFCWPCADGENMAKPSTTPAQAITVKAGGHEHTITGTVHSVATESIGFSGERHITIRMYGSIETRTPHDCNCNHCHRSYE